MSDTFTDNSGGMAQAPSSRYVRYVIFLLFAANVFNYMDRMALAVLAPLIKVDLELSDAQLGMLIGFAFALFYAICGIPLARWADRGIRRDIIVLALVTWSVMTALCGAAQNFWQLLAARVGVGAGEAGCHPSSQSLLCDYVPFARRSGAFAILSFGLIVGMMLGMALTGKLGETVGWRWTFVTLGLPGLVLALIIRLSLREPQRGACDVVQGDNKRLPFGAAMAVLWQCRTYRLLILFSILNNFLQFGLSQWWPAYFTRMFGLSLTTVGTSLGVALGAGSGVGLLIGGLLANKAARHDVRRPLMIGAAAIALVLPVALGSLFTSSVSASISLIALTGLLWSIPNGSVLANIYSVMMPHMRATAAAVGIFFISVFGIGLGPFCVGLLSDVLMPFFGAQSLRYALLAPISLIPIVVIALNAAAKTLPHDLKTVGN